MCEKNLFVEGTDYGDAEYSYQFDESLEKITGKDVLVHISPLRSKPSVICLTLRGDVLVFPVKEVDKYLKRIDKIGRRILNLCLRFDPVNSIELLDMVVARFPNVCQLFMNYSQEHPVEHALNRWSQLPNLFNVNLTFPIQLVLESIHQLSPFPNMTTLRCQTSIFTDEYSHYTATLPVLFPNLTKLEVACSEKVLEQIETNIRTLLPKLEFVQVIEVAPPEDDMWDGAEGEIARVYF